MGNIALSREIFDDSQHSEERLVRRGDFDMRLVINRPHAHMRIMDYRAGNYEDKRELLDALARREGLHKVFTVVEKQDSNTWRSLGFIREAVYPSFFRTADAYMMSRVYDEEGNPTPVDPLRASGEEKTRFPGRRLRKPDGLTFTELTDERSRAVLLEQANGDLCALPFSRVKPPDLVLQAKARGGRRVSACAEINESFGHATIGFTPAPDNEAMMILSAYAGNNLIEMLREREVNNLFAVAPILDRWRSELFAGLGFKVTGRLYHHLCNGEGYLHALSWHRRLEGSEETPSA